jgi:hypothetical protein
LDRWFESTRPPAPSLLEVVVELRRDRDKARRFVGWTVVTLAVLASLCILGAAELARVRGLAASASGRKATMATDDSQGTPVASDAVEPPHPSGSTVGNSATAAPAPSPPPDTGELRLTPSIRKQPIFVDGQKVGAGHQPVRLACGGHVVRVGAAGKVRTVVVPRGGSVTLAP